MPPQKNARRKARKELKQFLRSSGVAGNYGPLIREAIINNWSEQRFVIALVRTKTFKRQYPGVVRGGNINDFLLGQQGAGLNFNTLGSALNTYRQLWQSYETAGRAAGYGKLNKNQIAALIQGEKSPEEFGADAQAIKLVRTNRQAFDLLNEQRKAAGLDPLDNKSLFSAAASRDRKFIDFYEATRLRQLGANIGFSAEEANQIAKALPNVDAAGNVAYADVGKLVSDLRTQLADIGPELQQEGITPVELAKYLSSGEDPTGIGLRIQQLVARRRSQGQFQQGAARPRPQGATPGAAAYG